MHSCDELTLPGYDIRTAGNEVKWVFVVGWGGGGGGEWDRKVNPPVVTKTRLSLKEALMMDEIVIDFLRGS